MVYDGCPNRGDGKWHCPFQMDWVERKKQAAKICEPISAQQIELACMRIESGEYYQLPPGDFLSEPQDARGLPLSYCREEERRYRNHPNCCTAIYDYDSVPDMVISNGHDDWPLRVWEPVLRA